MSTGLPFRHTMLLYGGHLYFYRFPFLTTPMEEFDG